MEINNPRYKNQGIHVISVIFTVEQGITKVLLIKRKNNPYFGKWVLTGGALYNDEEITSGARRELEEKTGIKDVDLKEFAVFGDINRSPVMRMIAIAYIGIIDSKRVNLIKETRNTNDADWFPIDQVKDLGYDHDKILNKAIIELRKEIVKSNILKSLFPDGVTIPELQKTYESILDKKFDRRNFRKKILSLDLLYDTNKYSKFEGRKPAKLYKFKDDISNMDIF